MVKCLAKVFLPSILTCAALKLVHDACLFVSPIVLRYVSPNQWSIYKFICTIILHSRFKNYVCWSSWRDLIFWGCQPSIEWRQFQDIIYLIYPPFTCLACPTWQNFQFRTNFIPNFACWYRDANAYRNSLCCHRIPAYVSDSILCYRALIRFVKDPEEPAWRGYFYAAVMFLFFLLQTAVLHQYSVKAMLIGMRLRSTICASVYNKVCWEAKQSHYLVS